MEVTGDLEVTGALDVVTGALVVVGVIHVVTGQVQAGYVVGAAVVLGTTVPAHA